MQMYILRIALTIVLSLDATDRKAGKDSRERMR